MLKGKQKAACEAEWMRAKLRKGQSVTAMMKLFC